MVRKLHALIGLVALSGVIDNQVTAHKAIDDDVDTVTTTQIETDSTQAVGKPNEGLDKLDKVVKSAEEEVELDPMQLAMKYKTEIGFGLLFFLTFVFYWTGSNQNKRMALTWHQKMLPLIKDNFCYVGMEDGREATNLE